MSNTPDVFLRKVTESHSEIVTEDRGILLSLHNELAFFAKNYQFSPKYRDHLWDGKIRLVSLRDRLIPTGLTGYVRDWCNKYGYSFGTNNKRLHVGDTQQILDFCKELKPYSGGQRIEHRDYQLAAIVKAVKNEKYLLLSPTSSGKSLTIYSIVRWFSELKTLIIVPTVSLVGQLYGDFEDYENHGGWTQENCHKIYAGKDKNSDQRIHISTWQSLQKLPPEYFHQFDAVIVDEAHTAAGKTITKILGCCANAGVRIGTTGTIEDGEMSEMQMVSLFGPIYVVTTTKKLMDEGSVSTLKIKCLLLDYPDEHRKAKRDYDTEKSFVNGYTPRNEFIKLLTSQLKGNTLVLVNNIDTHLKPLHELLKDLPGKKVHIVYGKTDVEDRELIRKICEKSTDNLILASYQTLSTGVNIKNLQNVVFGSSSKSKIRILQSIGRGLRLDGKQNKMFLYDIIDDLTWKSRKGYFMKHFEDRLSHYEREQFAVSIKKIPLA